VAANLYEKVVDTTEEQIPEVKVAKRKVRTAVRKTKARARKSRLTEPERHTFNNRSPLIAPPRRALFLCRTRVTVMRIASNAHGEGA